VLTRPAEGRAEWSEQLHRRALPMPVIGVLRRAGDYMDWTSGHGRSGRPGLELLHRDTGMSKRTLRRHLKHGVDAGVLTVTARSAPGHTTCYAAVVPADVPVAAATPTGPRAADDGHRLPPTVANLHAPEALTVALLAAIEALSQLLALLQGSSVATVGGNGGHQWPPSAATVATERSHSGQTDANGGQTGADGGHQWPPSAATVATQVAPHPVVTPKPPPAPRRDRSREPGDGQRPLVASVVGGGEGTAGGDRLRQDPAIGGQTLRRAPPADVVAGVLRGLAIAMPDLVRTSEAALVRRGLAEPVSRLLGRGWTEAELVEHLVRRSWSGVGDAPAVLAARARSLLERRSPAEERTIAAAAARAAPAMACAAHGDPAGQERCPLCRSGAPAEPDVATAAAGGVPRPAGNWRHLAATVGHEP
jgi:hypothetical protein